MPTAINLKGLGGWDYVEHILEGVAKEQDLTVDCFSNLNSVARNTMPLDLRMVNIVYNCSLSYNVMIIHVQCHVVLTEYM